MFNKLILLTFALIAELSLILNYRGIEHRSEDFTNTRVDRKINLAQNIMTISNKINFKSNKPDAAYAYRYAMLKNNTRSLIYINAVLRSTGEGDIPLKLDKVKGNDLFDYYDISFKNYPLNYEEERSILVTERYFEKLELLPKKIKLKEDQLVVLKDTINLVSLYETETQATNVEFINEHVNIM
jgi:hypothetical protein